MRGIIFACTNKSEKECFERLLFGANKIYAPVAMRVKKGDFLFLLNLDTDVLYGVFKASSDAQMNIQKDAWNGKYPYQVKVKPVGNIVSIKNAKKLLKILKIERHCVICEKVTLKLLQLFKPPNSSMEEWLRFLNETEGVINFEIIQKPITWEGAIDLSDIKRLKTAAEEELPMLEATTCWDFPRQSYGNKPKGDNKYPGVTPAALIWNFIWKYSEPGDLVVDPMAGSGTTLDVCREEGRRCICYDIAPTRPDVIQNDSRSIPLPDNSVDLVFVDSPYGDNIKYNDDPRCIGKISSETEAFYDELEKVVKECYRILKPGKKLGWLIGDQWVKGKFTPVGFKFYQRLLKYFEPVDIILVTRRGQISHTGSWYTRARKYGFFLRGFKYFFIMQKPLSEKLSEKPRKIKWTFYERKNKNNNK